MRKTKKRERVFLRPYDRVLEMIDAEKADTMETRNEVLERWARLRADDKRRALKAVPDGFWVHDPDLKKRVFVGRIKGVFYVSWEGNSGWKIGEWRAVHYWEEKQREILENSHAV